MTVLAQAVALLAILGTGIVYGTDAFCALVQRPALNRVDDAVLTVVMGNVHRYGDRREPVPGVIGLVASVAATALAAVAGLTAASWTAGAAVVLWVLWLILYARVSAPINRVLTGAVDRHETPPNARALQHAWDRIIVLRATLLGAVVLALGASIILG